MKRELRYRFICSFNGHAYAGWQAQTNAQSIQDTIESALQQITQEQIRITGCSRTDAGVHALKFYGHFDATTSIPTEKLQQGLNSLLPEDIAILSLETTASDFHARKLAVSKIYRYEIWNDSIRDPFRLHRVWHISQALDVEAMQQAARHLIGEHDFSCFQGSDPNPRNPLRTLDQCSVNASGPHGITIEVQSKGFLKYMVRNIVGTLVEVGLGKREANSMNALLASKDRCQAGQTAPPEGLYLVEVFY